MLDNGETTVMVLGEAFHGIFTEYLVATVCCVVEEHFFHVICDIHVVSILASQEDGATNGEVKFIADLTDRRGTLDDERYCGMVDHRMFILVVTDKVIDAQVWTVKGGPICEAVVEAFVVDSVEPFHHNWIGSSHGLGDLLFRDGNEDIQIIGVPSDVSLV